MAFHGLKRPERDLKDLCFSSGTCIFRADLGATPMQKKKHHDHLQGLRNPATSRGFFCGKTREMMCFPVVDCHRGHRITGFSMTRKKAIDFDRNLPDHFKSKKSSTGTMVYLSFNGDCVQNMIHWIYVETLFSEKSIS